MKSLALQRKGSWLKARTDDGGESFSWQMAAVHGPLTLESEEREYFRIETACKELLLVSRARGEKGMRELRLDSVLPSRLAARGDFFAKGASFAS